MSTKKTTKQTNAYNQASLNAFNQLQPQTSALLQAYMYNPEAVVSPYFDLAIQQSQRQATQLGQRGIQNLTGNMAALGYGGANLPAFLQSQIAAQGRETSALQSNAALQGNLAKQQAVLGVQQAGVQGGLGYRPLQTGGTQTQQQGGLGSYLPQVAGAALGAAGMFGGAPASPGGNPFFAVMNA